MVNEYLIPKPTFRPLNWYVFVTIAAAVTFLLFFLLSLLIHENFATAAFDMGIFDQAFWRYSHFLDTFNTVRGLPILGDHFSLIAVIFGPLYFIYPSVGWPLAAQALSVAMGGVILFMIARLRLRVSPWLGIALVLSYYIHPVVHSTLLWQYHEIVLASGLYMGLIWSYIKQRQALFVVMILLLLACREDMPVTIAAFGLLALIEKRWVYAGWAIGLAIVWGFFALKVGMPYFNGQGYFRHENGTLAPLLANITNPYFYQEHLLNPKSLQYAWQVVFPVGFIAIFSPRHLLPALPTLLVNMLIGAYNVQIGYHYSVSIMPFLYWGAIEAMRSSPLLARLQTKKLKPWLAAALVILTLFAYSQYSSLNLKDLPGKFNAWQANGPKRAFIEGLNEKIADKGVAASDFLLPHLSHRKNIYLFPNPWKIHYWGAQGENPHHPNQVDFMVLNTEAVTTQNNLIRYLTDTGIFRKIQEENDTLVFERVKQESSDRTQAIADFDQYLANNRLKFAEIAVSPSFSTKEAEFKRLDVAVESIQKAVPGGWVIAGIPRTTSLLDINFGEIPGGRDFHTRYVRAVVTVKSETNADAQLSLGSDDGVTVWLNGKQVHENIVSRAAHLGDDKLDVQLNAGRNVFLFRVNNTGGAWRLLAELKPKLDYPQ